MKSPLELVIFIGAMAAATLITRFLPFWLPSRVLASSPMRKLKNGLPAVILLLLIVYSLKNTALLLPPHGLPELIALSLTLGLHLWKRNALLSIASGTGVYMVLEQTQILTKLLTP